MLRLSLFTVVVTLVGCKAEPPRACQKMTDLCHTEVKTCVDLRASTLEHFGQGAVDGLDGCLLQANTCSEAAGCAGGQAAKATAAAAADFANAFVKELAPDKESDCIAHAKTKAEAAGCSGGAAAQSGGEDGARLRRGLQERSQRAVTRRARA